MGWQTRAACRDTDPELFFPVTDDDAVVARHLAQVRPVCQSCPVQTECLRTALDSGEDFGLWAATSPTERREIRRQRAAGIPDPIADRDPGCPACSLLFALPAVDGELCSVCVERTA